MLTFTQFVCEDSAFGKRLKTATTSHNDSYNILDSHPKTKGSSWQAGGCGVLAHALHQHLPGSKLVDVHNKKTGNTEHMAVHHNGVIYDADGATPEHKFIQKYKKRESIPHHDLELTDHNPQRARKSGIVIDRGLVSKTLHHLKTHLS